MTDQPATYERHRRAPKPLDRTRLEELALAYVARFATTAVKLRTYLERKLRERGYEGDDAPDIPGLIERFVARGFVDDAIYGRAKANGLVARGYGAMRVETALRAAGLGEELRAGFRPDVAAQRQAAMVLARKRGFGPYRLSQTPGDESPEASRKRREKQLAAMVRAGHDFDAARTVVEASTIEELEEWVDRARDEPR